MRVLFFLAAGGGGGGLLAFGGSGGGTLAMRGRAGGAADENAAGAAAAAFCSASTRVLCGSAGLTPSLNLVRVIGSASADSNDACVTQAVSPGFDLSHAQIIEEAVDDLPNAKTGRLVIDEATGGGVLIGGKNGEVWRGASFSHLLPLFLERVPLSVGSFSNANGYPVPLAVTDQYLAAPVLSLKGDAGLTNGFKVFDLRKISDFVLDELFRHDGAGQHDRRQRRYHRLGRGRLGGFGEAVRRRLCG